MGLFINEVVDSGEEVCQAGHEFGGKRNYYLMHIIKDGRGEFFSGGRKWSLKKGDAFLIFPEQMHLYKASNSEPWSYFWVGFRGDVSDLLSRLQVNPENPVFYSEDLDNTYCIFRNIKKARIKPHPSVVLENLGYINLLIGNLCNGKLSKDLNIGQAKTIIHHHVDSMRTFVFNNFNTPIQVQDVINYVQLERSYASRIFKIEAGVTIGEYIKNHRLEQAKLYLSEGWSGKETAYSCGFSDYNNFLKVFKKNTGITVGQFNNHSGGKM